MSRGVPGVRGEGKTAPSFDQDLKDLRKIEHESGIKIVKAGIPCEYCSNKACSSPCRRLRRYWREVST